MTSRKKTAKRSTRSRKANKAELKRAGVTQTLPTVDSTAQTALAAIRNITTQVDQIKSTADFAYNYAKVSDAGVGLAGLAANWLPGIDTESISDDTWAAFDAGTMRFKNELMLDAGQLPWFRRLDEDKYEILSGSQNPVKDDGAEWHRCDAAYACATGQQEFGQWKKHKPNLYAMVEPVRSAVRAYQRNKRRSILSAYKEYKRSRDDAQAGTRVQAKSFAEHIADFLAKLPNRNAAAIKRDDATARDPAVLKNAIAVFRKALNEKPQAAKA